MKAYMPLVFVTGVVFLMLVASAGAYEIPSHYPGYFIPTDFRIQSSYIVKPGENFQVSISGNGPAGWSGGVHVHWLSSDAEYVSAISSSGTVISPGSYGDYSFVECDGPYGISCTITLNALNDWGENIQIYYRGWNWDKDVNCGDGSYDYMRVPSSGICSSNCKNFPSDVMVCDSYSKAVPIQGCIRKGTLNVVGEPSLPGEIWQQGDFVSVTYKGSTCTHCTSPVSISINGGDCDLEYELTAKTMPCITSDPSYSSKWTLPEIPSECLGEEVVLTVSSEGMSKSMNMKLSSDPTRDERPTYVQGDFSQDSYYAHEKISYTAKASDDKNLAEIDIIASINGEPAEIVKTCQVSGKTATCDYTGDYYEPGTEICMSANARDEKGQEPYDWNREQSSCVTVCHLPSETDAGLDYGKKGTCKGCKSEGTDFCPIEQSKAFCCSGLSGQYWVFNKDLGNGMIECCKKEFPAPDLECEEVRTVNCNRLLGEYYSDGKECQLQYHECSSTQVCKEGACVTGSKLPTDNTTTTTTTSSTTSTTTTTSTSTTTTTIPSECNECQTDFDCSNYGADYICDTETHCCYNPNLPGAETVTLTISKGENIIGGNGLSEADFADCDLIHFRSGHSNCDYDKNGYFVYYNPSSPINGDCGNKFFSSDIISPGYGYYICAGEDCTVTFNRPSSMNILIRPGQNIISVPSETSADDILDLCGGSFRHFRSGHSNCDYDKNGYFVYYNPSSPINGDCGNKFFSDSTMKPFVGYYLYYDGTGDCTITFQDGVLITP